MIANFLRSPFLFISAVGLIGLLSIIHADGKSREAKPHQLDKNLRPVIVELFTSEGCSSCPPADSLLKHFSDQQPLRGVQIVALEEHVDYWNHLGWTDPFSSGGFSQRQSDYAQVFGREGVYTPQMIVDGQFEFVGSRSGEARETIQKAASLPKLDVSLNPAGSSDPEKLALEIQISNPRGTHIHEPAELWLAITEMNLQSDVKAGENSGEILSHAAVVRSLKKLDTLRDPAVYKSSVEASLDPKWRKENLSAVVFVAEKNSRKIIGVAASALHP